ncbi:cyanophycinase [Rugamonas apoptosis]|uniref:Cyanophycinase n=1 Tax=Rugamonas apoptosis TaxID=2758570 RepID=A0A7W2F9B4_9BURK|nr:cyanophycinase [Rugamonas apoptosis]MBA5687517.1 cyanophycinase [Rugamonas apoptosis]
MSKLSTLTPRAAWRTLAAIALAACAATAAAPTMAAAKGGAKPPYEYYATGNPQATVTLPTSYPTTSLVLMGGGPDVDQAFRWMITRAGIQPGTGGRFVVIRATGTDAYDPYLYYSDAAHTTSTTVADQWVGGASLGLTSAETLVIPSVAAANDPTVNAIVARANAVFIAGGDQSDYINYWKGTALDQTLRGLLARNVPMGGTSAGLAVLGQFDYAALGGSITTAQALSNPYHRYLTLDPNPLALAGGFLAPPALNSTILDSHLDARDRMGRLVTFVARLVARNGSVGCAGGVLPASSSGTATARGIGVGVETALLVQGNQSTGTTTARRVTNVSTTTESAVYFVRPAVAPSTCVAGSPLAMYGVEIRKLADSATVFDLGNWSGLPVYKTVDAVAGQLSPANPY